MFLALQAQSFFIEIGQQVQTVTSAASGHGHKCDIPYLLEPHEIKSERDSMNHVMSNDRVELARLVQQLAGLEFEAEERIHACEDLLSGMSQLMDVAVGNDVCSSTTNFASREKRRPHNNELGRFVQDYHELVQARNALGHSETQAQQEVDSFERLTDVELMLGLPSIAFDDANGAVVLGQDSDASVNKDLSYRTVGLERDAQGRIISAKPHPALGLNDEAAASGEHGDLAPLLTLLWERVCEQQQWRRRQDGAGAGGAAGATETLTGPGCPSGSAAWAKGQMLA